MRSEQKERTRQALLQSALQLAAAKGFAALSLREVAKEAGITPAAFYRHFKDMDELGLALIDEVGLGLRRLLRESRKSFDQQGTAVRASIETFVRYVTDHANLFRLLQGERQGSSGAFRRALHAEIHRFVDELAEDIERGSTELGRPLRDAGLAAEAITAVVFTVGAEALDLPRYRRDELIDRLIAHTKQILRGAQRPARGS